MLGGALLGDRRRRRVTLRMNKVPCLNFLPSRVNGSLVLGMDGVVGIGKALVYSIVQCATQCLADALFNMSVFVIRDCALLHMSLAFCDCLYHNRAFPKLGGLIAKA